MLTMRSGSSRSVPRLVEVTDGRACAFDLAAESASVGADGGGLVVVVTTSDDCVWAATSRASFLTVQSPVAGFGSGAVSVLVAANAGPARSGAIAVAGRTLVVSQDAGPSACAPVARPLKPVKTAKGALEATDCFEPGFGAHYADAFVVDSKAGRAYAFTVKAGFEAVVDVADGNGVIVASAMGPVARVTVSTPHGGPLFVSVSGTEPLATGSYKVKVAQRRAPSR
jgi:hypothetical protein